MSFDNYGDTSSIEEPEEYYNNNNDNNHNINNINNTIKVHKKNDIILRGNNNIVRARSGDIETIDFIRDGIHRRITRNINDTSQANINLNNILNNLNNRRTNLNPFNRYFRNNLRNNTNNVTNAINEIINLINSDNGNGLQVEIICDRNNHSFLTNPSFLSIIFFFLIIYIAMVSVVSLWKYRNSESSFITIFISILFPSPSPLINFILFFLLFLILLFIGLFLSENDNNTISVYSNGGITTISGTNNYSSYSY